MIGKIGIFFIVIGICKLIIAAVERRRQNAGR